MTIPTIPSSLIRRGKAIDFFGTIPTSDDTPRPKRTERPNNDICPLRSFLSNDRKAVSKHRQVTMSLKDPCDCTSSQKPMQMYSEDEEQRLALKRDIRAERQPLKESTPRIPKMASLRKFYPEKQVTLPKEPLPDVKRVPSSRQLCGDYREVKLPKDHEDSSEKQLISSKESSEEKSLVKLVSPSPLDRQRAISSKESYGEERLLPSLSILPTLINKLTSLWTRSNSVPRNEKHSPPLRQKQCQNFIKCRCEDLSSSSFETFPTSYYSKQMDLMPSTSDQSHSANGKKFRINRYLNEIFIKRLQDIDNNADGNIDVSQQNHNQLTSFINSCLFQLLLIS